MNQAVSFTQDSIAQITGEIDINHLSGQLIDKYKLLDELGRGGFGVVYEAERSDKTFEQKLAVKFIHASLSEVVSHNFLYLEAQLLAKLSHPYIAKVFDGGRHKGLIYIAMEKVEGLTLRDFIEKTNQSQKAKLELFLKICDAIAHAHQNRILHADIKPENVIIDKSGNPKILDFNITQKLATGTQQLDSSLLAYSENYASPEQKAGSYLTNQSDVYSLGRLLDFMLPEVSIHSDTFAVINRATEVNIADRYSSVETLASDIKNILTKHPVSIKQHLPGYAAKMLIKRKPFHTAACILAITGTILFSTVLVSKNQQLNVEKEIAENMMFELTQLMFHAKGEVDKEKSVQNMLELTRRRILSNPDLPRDLKQKMLLAMMTPVPERSGSQVTDNKNQNNNIPEERNE